jgi:hypothetical protein
MPTRLPDTFDSSNPFGDMPASGIGAEIEMLAADFAKLGVSAHSAVPLWMGKPNRFTGAVMHSAKEVLDYIAAELEAQARNRAEAHGDAPVQAPQASTGDADSVVTTTAPVNEAKRLHRERVHAANEAWRKAIQDRAASLVQWNAYVDGLRSEYQKLKLMKV